MTRTFMVLAATAVLGFGAAPAFAQTRVFVSGLGSDSNPCTLSAPCRSFQQAHNTVAAGGEIVALDAAGYGTVTINKAVTITAIGVEASITLPSNNAPWAAIVIHAGANDVVAIRGLSLFGTGGVSSSGIEITSAKSVTISDTSISGFGVGVNVGVSVDLDLELRAVSANNNGENGLLLEAGPGNLTALVSDSAFNSNGVAGVVGGIAVVNQGQPSTTRATFNNVTVAGNQCAAPQAGIRVLFGLGSGPMTVMITGSKLANNACIGLSAENTGATVFVDRTQITGNTGKAWQAINGAVVKSYTNNAVNGNGDDTLNGVTQITSQ